MADAKSRSPKAPAIPLQQAIDEVQPVFEEETRNRMSREVLAQHLGYSGISGASASKIGALRHYGLIEGREDDLRVSELAVDLLLKGQSTPEFKLAAQSACLSPSLFTEIFNEFDSRPSQANLEYWLIQRGAQKKSAPKLATTFLESADFADLWHKPAFPHETESENLPVNNLENRPKTPSPPTPHEDLPIDSSAARPPELRLVENEREISSGMISKDTKYRLLVDGPFNAREIENLIKRLQLEKLILTDE